jgi:hypothetical protein
MRDWVLGLAPGVWQWLSNASQGQATFLGTLTGSSIGLIALLIGALFNAHLNRKRDDRLRREDQRAVAAALSAELVSWRDELQSSVTSMRTTSIEPEVAKWSVPILARSLFPEMVSKLGLLSSTTIRSVIAAHSEAEWYSWRLSQFTGAAVEAHPDFPSSLQFISLPYDLSPAAISLMEQAIKAIEHAIIELDRY